MKIKFYSEDGKVFDDKKQCVEYEEKLEAEKAEKKKKEEEMESRKKEVNDAYDTYIKLRDKYIDDYKSYEYKLKDNDYIPAIYRLLSDIL